MMLVRRIDLEDVAKLREHVLSGTPLVRPNPNQWELAALLKVTPGVPTMHRFRTHVAPIVQPPYWVHVIATSTLEAEVAALKECGSEGARALRTATVSRADTLGPEDLPDTTPVW